MHGVSGPLELTELQPLQTRSHGAAMVSPSRAARLQGAPRQQWRPRGSWQMDLRLLSAWLPGMRLVVVGLHQGPQPGARVFERIPWLGEEDACKRPCLWAEQRQFRQERREAIADDA